jgi:hypothetical protein
MRPLFVLFFLILEPAAALAVFARAGATPLARTLHFINAGTQPVYAIRVGRRAGQAWSDDLLASNEVIDVGEEHAVRVPLGGGCRYDVRFEYRGGAAGEVDNVDLCTVNRVFLKETR